MPYTTVYIAQRHKQAKQSILMCQNLESQIYLKYVLFCVFLLKALGTLMSKLKIFTAEIALLVLSSETKEESILLVYHCHLKVWPCL